MSKGKQLTGQIEGEQDVLTREEVLQILSEMAQKGSVSAAVALERALRLEDPDDDDDEEPDELETNPSRWLVGDRTVRLRGRGLTGG